MKKKKLLIAAVVTSILGLALLLGGALLPRLTIMTPLGLLITLLGAALSIISWAWYLVDALKAKSYPLAIFLAVPGALLIVIEVVRIFK